MLQHRLQPISGLPKHKANARAGTPQGSRGTLE